MSFDLIESYRSKKDILIKLKRKKSDIEQWKSNIGTFDYCCIVSCFVSAYGLINVDWLAWKKRSSSNSCIAGQES
jgi:D-mannonate dehydratase